MKEILSHVSVGDTERSASKRPRKKTKGQSKKEIQIQSIVDYISEHPLCPATEIQKYRRVSSATVNRILAQFKAEGIVEYIGSRRSGGYQLVEHRGQTPPPEQNSPLGDSEPYGVGLQDSSGI